MKTTAAATCAVMLFLVSGGWGLAQEPVQAPPAPLPAADDCACVSPRLPLSYDLGCDPHCLPHSQLLCPHEWFVRVGPDLIVSDGDLREVLETGVAVQLGAKAFSYNGPRDAACTGELGLDIIFNDGDDPKPVPVRGVPRILDNMYRMYVHVAGGREWYGGGDAYRYLLGIDGGGRVGHAHVNFTTLPDRTDIPYGLFLGFNGGVLIPYHVCDLTVGGRLQLGFDWLDVIDSDSDLGQLDLLFTAGLRY